MKSEARIIPLGDSALLVRFGEEIDLAINQRVHALDRLLHFGTLTGVIETVPAYTTLLVCYDPLLLTYGQAAAWIDSRLDQVEASIPKRPHRIKVPVRYGGEDGPDLEFVAAYNHISTREVVRIHTSLPYTVYMIGFTPGFPYMGKLDEAIVTPRLETPRTRVPMGSVAIAGAQTGIYPIDSPGGWRLIGRTSLRLFDLRADSPFLFSPGDEVVFSVEAIHA